MKPIYLRRSSLALFCPFTGKPRDVRDQEQVDKIFLHITGRATWKNASKNKQHPLGRLERYFTSNGKPFAHYGIDPWGRTAQFAEETERPWAQGWGKYGGYDGLKAALEEKKLTVPYWWRRSMRTRLAEVKSPLDLVEEGTTPNHNAVAIEMVQYGGQFKLTTAQYLAAFILCWDICLRHGLVFSDGTILGHEDVDPWGRGDNGGGWDPGAGRITPRWCWDSFFSYAEAYLSSTRALSECPHPKHEVEGRRCCSAIRETPARPDWLEAIERSAFGGGGGGERDLGEWDAELGAWKS
jgi:hypothetical protein